MMLLPTGTGKTNVSAMIVHRALAEHKWKTLFLAQRRKLVEQAADTFKRFGIISCIEMADLKESEQSSIIGEPEAVIATIQTLSGSRLTSKKRDRFDLIVVDECHHALGENYKDIIDHFSGARLLGITATADGSKKNIGSVFETLAYRLPLRQAMEIGALVPIILRTIPVEVNLRDLKMTTSDFSETEIGARISAVSETLAYNIAHNIGDRQTIVFTPDLGSASAMASMLRAMGVKAKYVAGTAGQYRMPQAERDKILEEFQNNEFQVIVSCDLLIEGYDCPQVSCVCICRVTQLRYKYVQMAGRGMRLHPGKQNLLILDFDWKTDESSKRLCVPVALFAETTDEEVADVVTGKIRSRNNKDKDDGDQEIDFDLLEEIKEAEQGRKFVKELAVSYTGRFAKKYAVIDTDPVGVGKIIDMKLKSRYDMNPSRDQSRGGGPASDAQAKFLRSLGMHSPETMSKWGASKMISKLLQGQRQGKASFQQIKCMLSAGVREDQARDMSRREAAAVITEIITRKNSPTQSMFF